MTNHPSTLVVAYVGSVRLDHDPPPEPCEVDGHFVIEVADIEKAIMGLKGRAVVEDSVRIDEHAGTQFTFFTDPDGLPLELDEK